MAACQWGLWERRKRGTMSCLLSCQSLNPSEKICKGKHESKMPLKCVFWRRRRGRGREGWEDPPAQNLKNEMATKNKNAHERIEKPVQSCPIRRSRERWEGGTEGYLHSTHMPARHGLPHTGTEDTVLL